MSPRERPRGAHANVSRAQLVAAAAARLDACHGMSELAELAAECLHEALDARSAVARIEQDEARPLWTAPASERPIDVLDAVTSVRDRPALRRALVDRAAWTASTSGSEAPVDPAGDARELELLAAAGMSALLCVPIVVNGGVWGLFSAVRGHGVFDDDDVAVARVIAALTAAAIIRLDFEHQVFHLLAEDPLTGLADRRVADAAAERALDSGVETCIVMCDVDGLKQVNDELGHAAGDDLLRTVAGVLRHISDALPGSTAARIGGDEFCLVVPGWPRATVEDVLVRTMDEQPLPHGAAISWGVAASSIGERVPISNLFRAADFAQYRVKRARARRRQLALPESADPMVTAQQVLARALPAIAAARPGTLSRLCALASTATDTLGGGAWTVLRGRDQGPAAVVARGGSPSTDAGSARTLTVTEGAWGLEVGTVIEASGEAQVRTALAAAMYVAVHEVD